jgi:hypothetical protein
MWRLPEARLMVTQTHEGKEFPYRVNVVCAPPDPR